MSKICNEAWTGRVKHGKKKTEDRDRFTLLLPSWWFQICFIFTPIWGNDPIWIIFSNGLKPPTSSPCCYILDILLYILWLIYTYIVHVKVFLLVYILVISFHGTIRFCWFRLIINMLWRDGQYERPGWPFFPDRKVTRLPGRFHCLGGASTRQFQRSSTLQGTKISHPKALLKMIFLFRRWGIC